jgi:MerR family transcriptional regulator, redox-sensitive transcriptional activator SoxR
MPLLRDQITIVELAQRSGVAPSALRYYESLGLIVAARTAGNQRRYARPTLRRVALIRAAQRVGLSLEEIAAALGALPENRTATKADWARLSRAWRCDLEARIHDLELLRDELTGCISCGCLSLRTCRLLNRDDEAGLEGSGARLFEDEMSARGGAPSRG